VVSYLRVEMDHFEYRNRRLHCEGVPVEELARTYGTPLYVYSEATLVHHLTQIQKAFAEADPLLCSRERRLPLRRGE
jgi:diaminopimelate decarboxylase